MKKTNRKRTTPRAARARTTAPQRTGAFVPPAPSSASAVGAADRVALARTKVQLARLKCGRVRRQRPYNQRRMEAANLAYTRAYFDYLYASRSARAKGGTNTPVSNSGPVTHQ